MLKDNLFTLQHLKDADADDIHPLIMRQTCCQIQNPFLVLPGNLEVEQLNSADELLDHGCRDGVGLDVGVDDGD